MIGVKSVIGLYGDLRIDRRVGRGGRDRRHAERVAVRRRARDLGGADRAAAAGLVVDDQRLAERPVDLLGDDAGDDVGGAAGRERNDQPHRLGRIARLGPAQAGHDGEKGGAGKQGSANRHQHSGREFGDAGV